MCNRQFPPRGSGAQNVLEAPPSQAWVHPDQLGPHWDWKPGRVLLGKWKGRLIGRDDDRHVVTLAGNRAGKTQTALIPNLLRYPGSTVNLDPKGELAKATAAARRRMGQRVFVFDPFGITGMTRTRGPRTGRRCSRRWWRGHSRGTFNARRLRRSSKKRQSQISICALRCCIGSTSSWPRSAGV